MERDGDDRRVLGQRFAAPKICFFSSTDDGGVFERGGADGTVPRSPLKIVIAAHFGSVLHDCTSNELICAAETISVGFSGAGRGCSALTPDGNANAKYVIVRTTARI